VAKHKKTGNARISNKYYIFCVCVCSLLSSMQRACSVLYCHLRLKAKSHKNIYFRTVNRHSDKLLINIFTGNGGRNVISIQLPEVPKNPPHSQQQARLSGAPSALCTNANASFLKAMQSFSPYHSVTTFTCCTHDVYFFMM
jgi:hypothetical protein